MLISSSGLCFIFPNLLNFDRTLLNFHLINWKDSSCVSFITRFADQERKKQISKIRRRIVLLISAESCSVGYKEENSFIYCAIWKAVFYNFSNLSVIDLPFQVECSLTPFAVPFTILCLSFQSQISVFHFNLKSLSSISISNLCLPFFSQSTAFHISHKALSSISFTNLCLPFQSQISVFHSFHKSLSSISISNLYLPFFSQSSVFHFNLKSLSSISFTKLYLPFLLLSTV